MGLGGGKAALRWRDPARLLRYGQEYCLTKSDPNPTAETQVDTPTWLIAVRAAEAKQATDIKVLDLTGITSFADYFVICTGANSKQIQAISDEVGHTVEEAGPRTAQQPGGLQPVGVGSGRLRRPSDPHLLAQSARVLRSGAAVAHGQNG